MSTRLHRLIRHKKGQTQSLTNTTTDEKLVYLQLLKQRKAPFQRKLFRGSGVARFTLGCLLLWVISLSFIFSFGQKHSLLVSAGSLISGDNSSVQSVESEQYLLPTIKFADLSDLEEQNLANPEVLGARDTVDQTLNPYQAYPFTSKLYELNPELVEQIKTKITSYIDQYRSYEGGDSRYDPPVAPVIYLEVSLKYKVPLSYTLAIARLESRFGTDCYSQNNLTRICKHKNIYSMGLDDSGNNITYNSWEDGVEAFGKWYSARVSEGYGTCQIWRRYNPNGDYCQKVMNLSRDIESFFNRPLS